MVSPIGTVWLRGTIKVPTEKLTATDPAQRHRVFFFGTAPGDADPCCQFVEPKKLCVSASLWHSGGAYQTTAFRSLKSIRIIVAIPPTDAGYAARGSVE
jgi:hypothetical protein